LLPVNGPDTALLQIDSEGMIMWRFLRGLLIGLTPFTALAAESADGTTIPVATQIEDSHGAIWTLRLSDRTVLKDGVATPAVNALEIWYLNHEVWVYFGGYWWKTLDQFQTSGQTIPAVTHPVMPTTPGLRLAVGPQASVSCSGVTVNPGDTIQTLVDANPAGTVFCLTPGTYKNQAVAPKTGDQFIGTTDGVILDGRGTTPIAFGGNVTHVVIKNLVITNYATATQQATVKLFGAYTLIQHNEVKLATEGAGVWVGDHGLVIANKINANAQEGYKVVGSDDGMTTSVGATFDSNQINDNNPTRGYWDGGEQGGGKALNTLNLAFWYNEANDNGGSGFWTDWNNQGTIYWYNKAYRNSNGIEHEISFNASIIGNDLQDNGNPEWAHASCRSSYFSCGGVVLENSGGVITGPYTGIIEIAYNNIKSGQYGRAVAFRQQNRGPYVGAYTTGPYPVRNISVHHNTMNLSAGYIDPQVGAVQDTGTDLLFAKANNIRFDYNTYTCGTPTRCWFAWNNYAWNTFANWQSYGMDLHSTTTP
jgi:hypothetical protein